MLALITEIGCELATYINITGGPGMPVKPPVKPPKPPTENITNGFNFPLYRTPKLIKTRRIKDKIDINLEKSGLKEKYKKFDSKKTLKDLFKKE